MGNGEWGKKGCIGVGVWGEGRDGEAVDGKSWMRDNAHG